MRPRAALRALLLALLALPLAAGATWTLRNLGSIPHYGDSLDYVELAQTGRVDDYRGVAYPAFLSLVHRLAPDEDWLVGLESEVLELPTAPIACHAAPGLVYVQLAQLGLALLAALYVLGVVLDVPALRREWGAGRARALHLGLALLLVLDPLVAHYSLAVMTDGLTLWSCGVAAAAWAELTVRRRSPLRSGLVLFGAATLASSLRPEKAMVLLGTAALAPAAGLLLARLRPAAGPSRRGLGTALAVVVLAFGLVTGLKSAAPASDDDRWPLTTTLLHFRLVYPHLEEIHPALPPEVRERITPEAAAFYDRKIHNSWKVMDAVSGGDPELRDELTRAMVATALREVPGKIALDCAGDTFENLFTTPFLHARAAAWEERGGDLASLPRGSNGSVWNLVFLSYHDPAASRALVTASWVALLAAAAAAVVLRRRRAVPRREGARPLATALPFLSLWVVNSAVFALSANFVEFRYALFSHALLVAVLYGALLAGLLAPRERADA
jgi:hypothetical protein